MSLGNKQIMAENIKRLLNAKGLNPRQLAIALDFKYTTVNDWVNAKTYPRIDKIEKMADFFHVTKSDLVEEYQPVLNSNDSNTFIGVYSKIFETLSESEKHELYKVLEKAIKKSENSDD